MSARMPALRQDLDVMPSPVADRPGVLVRDPIGFAEGMLVIPPPLVPLLAIFDGRSDVADVKAALVRQAGDVRAAAIVEHLLETLGSGGFLVDETYASRRAARERAFAEAPVRAPAHAGSAYPDEPKALARTLDGYLDGARAPQAGLVAIAAPHVSPEGGWRSYAAAYGALDPSLADRTFVVLGTSHYGRPEAFGLTRKPFATPVRRDHGGRAASWTRWSGPAGPPRTTARRSSTPSSSRSCSSSTSSGPRSAWSRSCAVRSQRATQAGLPEDDPGVARFLEALRALWETPAGSPLRRPGRRPGPRGPAVRGPPDRPGPRAGYDPGFGAGPGSAGAGPGRRCGGVLAARPGGRRRPQVVRGLAPLRVFEDGGARARGDPGVRAVEHRRRERRDLRGPHVSARKKERADEIRA